MGVSIFGAILTSISDFVNGDSSDSFFRSRFSFSRRGYTSSKSFTAGGDPLLLVEQVAVGNLLK